MSNVSGFTSQERHDIIMQTLSDIGKGPECFKTRWKADSGDHLTDEILLQTPMFWFMKYKWTQQEIETLFYKAQIVITDTFDSALQQTFGGDTGLRWKGGGGTNYKQNKHNKEDDTMNYHINHPNFEYNPVIQPVDFQATGGVNNKNKDNPKKQYGGNPDWQPLEKEPNDNNKGYGPTMGKGKRNDDDFLEAISNELKAEDMDSNENRDSDLSDEAIVDLFGAPDLDDMDNGSKSLHDLDNDENAHVHYKGTKSLGSKVTRGKINRKKLNKQKLKRQAGGIGITTKSSTPSLLKKSSKLREEKATLDAIRTAQQDTTNVTKHQF